MFAAETWLATTSVCQVRSGAAAVRRGRSNDDVGLAARSASTQGDYVTVIPWNWWPASPAKLVSA